VLCIIFGFVGYRFLRFRAHGREIVAIEAPLIELVKQEPKPNVINLIENQLEVQSQSVVQGQSIVQGNNLASPLPYALPENKRSS